MDPLVDLLVEADALALVKVVAQVRAKDLVLDHAMAALVVASHILVPVLILKHRVDTHAMDHADLSVVLQLHHPHALQVVLQHALKVQVALEAVLLHLALVVVSLIAQFSVVPHAEMDAT